MTSAPELNREIAMSAMPTKVTMFSGKHVAPLELRPKDIDVLDIAHHLAMQVRWSGAVKWHYSVAQHSWHCSYLVPEEQAYDALMHDSPETYLQDMSKPLKNHQKLGAGYRWAERRVEKVIGPTLKVQFPVSPEVKSADLAMLIAEAEQLVHGRGHWGYYEDVVAADIRIPRWRPETAERKFLERYEEVRP